MTLSLLHVHPETGTSASLAATGSVAVGGYVNHCWRGLGACATQGLTTNPWYPEGVRRALEQGLSAQDALNDVVAGDAGASRRQCLVVDADGRSALHTGIDNQPVVASARCPGVAAAGNMLADAAVPEAMVTAFLAATCEDPDAVLKQGKAPRFRETHDVELLAALIEALEAGLVAGGDHRGCRSVALRIESFTMAPIDLRVDWVEADPVTELRALAHRVASEDFQAFLRSLPHR
ncbi:DUF1028 domain-containing protein [Halomonas elongata]|uniref:DUF1028 domain-containing protein n=1 Tax=Halomonas elongata TaxID=2746 RepID=UPI00186BA11F|nr:DUF1028 domain-containing protein [Halomonas elongata]MBW5801210.1 DUF1028 domain-containing protein [Halomonas elongata]